MGDSNKRPETQSLGRYNISKGLDNAFNVCYVENMPKTNSSWQAQNPLLKTLPTFLVQLSVVILLIHISMIILKPIRQPRFVSELLAGIVLGPSALGTYGWVAGNFNSFEGGLFLETMGNLGLTFYMFLVGLEMDLTTIPRMGKTAFTVALAGTIVPAFAGVGLYRQVSKIQSSVVYVPPTGGFFWAIALTVTSFPDLARMLSNLKLMYTDLGKTALTSTLLTELFSWFLLVAMVAYVNGNSYTIIPTAVFCAFSWWVTRPILSRVIKGIASRNEPSTEGKYSDVHVCCILSAALLNGFITELCGVHSMFGAFIFGLIIPSGELGTKIMDKIEAYVLGILMPPVFYNTGLRTNFQFINSGIASAWLVPLVVVVASSVKVVSILLVCLYLKCPMRDSLALGVLMSTKGVLAIIVLNEGRNVAAFDNQTYTWMILSILIMTGMVGPIVSFTHKSARHSKQFYRRNLERSKPDDELRVLACVHSSRNLSGLINLLHFSNATRISPLTVYAVHLVELTGRASAMLIFHDKSKTSDTIGNDNNPTREKAEAEQIISAFESFQKDSRAAIVQPLTVVSSYTNMHEDVRHFALDKRVTVILLPFHKKPSGARGGWTEENAQHKLVTENLLANAPCSIGILVDRGLTPPLPPQTQHDRMLNRRIAMLFIEGPDYREALAYAWRMAATTGVSLTVLRFIPGKDVVELAESVVEGDDGDDEVFQAIFEKEKERLLDDDYINEFRFRTMHDQFITYLEKPVNGGDEIVSIIRSAYNDFNLFIVGRAHGMESPLTSGLSDWCDCPELGLLGETLVSAEFLPSASVLVMQQSAPPASVSKKNMSSAQNKGVSENSGQSSALPFVNHRKTYDSY